MKTALAACAAAMLLAHAPIQCTRTPDPDTRLEDQPGDALFALAEKFRAEGNTTAADSTLRYLIEKYPSDRHAPLAREMLAGKTHDDTSATNATSAPAAPSPSGTPSGAH
jgi:hypothetical protein